MVPYCSDSSPSEPASWVSNFCSCGASHLERPCAWLLIMLNKVPTFHFPLGPTSYVGSLLQLPQSEFILFSSLFLYIFFGTCFNYDTNLHYNLIIIYFLSQRAIVDAVGTHPDVFYQPVHPSPSCCKRWLLMAAISFFQRILLLQRYKQSILCLKVGALCHVIHIAELPVVSLRTRLQETIAEPTSSPSFIL